MPDIRLTLPRVEWLRRRHGSAVEDMMDAESGRGGGFEHLLTFDPSKKAVHLQHVIRWFLRGAIRIEDAEDVRLTLERYDRSRLRLPEAKRDIAAYDTPGDLEEAFDRLAGGAFDVGSIPDDVRVQSPCLASGSGWGLYRLDGHQASSWWADSTKWCTRHRDSYEEYAAAGPLYVLSTGKDKIQASPDRSVVMDRYDRPVTEEWLQRFPFEARLALVEVICRGEWITGMKMHAACKVAGHFVDEDVIAAVRNVGQSTEIIHWGRDMAHSVYGLDGVTTRRGRSPQLDGFYRRVFETVPLNAVPCLRFGVDVLTKKALDLWYRGNDADSVERAVSLVETYDSMFGSPGVKKDASWSLTKARNFMTEVLYDPDHATAVSLETIRISRTVVERKVPDILLEFCPKPVARLLSSIGYRRAWVHQEESLQGTVDDLLAAADYPGAGILLAAIPLEERTPELIESMVAAGRGEILGCIPPIILDADLFGRCVSSPGYDSRMFDIECKSPGAQTVRFRHFDRMPAQLFDYFNLDFHPKSGNWRDTYRTFASRNPTEAAALADTLTDFPGGLGIPEGFMVEVLRANSEALEWVLKSGHGDLLSAAYLVKPDYRTDEFSVVR